MKARLTEADAKRALSDHLLEKAGFVRARFGVLSDVAGVERLLRDAELVRYPTELRFDRAPLLPGEFGCAVPRGEHPSDGFVLAIDPWFRAREEAVPALVLYHIPPINYGDLASPDDCERFASASLGMDQTDYYEMLCALADGMPARGIAGAVDA